MHLPDVNHAIRALLQEEQKLQIWRLSYHMWNTCVDLANSMPVSQQFDEEHAKLRHLASDLLLVARNIQGIPSAQLKTATFFHRTAGQNCVGIDAGNADVHVARQGQGVLVRDCRSHLELAEQYFCYGKSLLAKSEEGGAKQTDFLKFLNQAFEICSEALFKCTCKPEERVLLSNLKLKTLRYLAAAHLQVENFESVLKCVTVLAEESDHLTTPFLALKVYIGLGMREAAERELNALLLHNAAPLDIYFPQLKFLFNLAVALWRQPARHFSDFLLVSRPFLFTPAMPVRGSKTRIML
ncbi:hypothetical protein KI387_044026 [Taxus chinensis]|uniref:Uncharacterized protein n=1 Tax=Taxus chinensis TaxID=29808 RepID=A0AA38FZS5_TAXCH|nr:hypothetical protein KI387_044026 [Taxus chinensis]